MALLFLLLVDMYTSVFLSIFSKGELLLGLVLYSLQEDSPFKMDLLLKERHCY